MTLALDAAGGQPEPSAWTHVELGKLYLARGDLRAAERHFRGALELFPGYVYANDQLARVEAARGHLENAIVLERRVVETVPLPQFVSELGDLYERAGRAAQAQRQVRLVRAIDRLLQANGIRTDLEMTVFDADHRIGTATLVARARAARAERPSILGDDALAWALARTGRCDEARRGRRGQCAWARRTRSLFFHRAEIERCLGNKARASAWARKALSVNSTFSTRFAPVARRLAVAAPSLEPGSVTGAHTLRRPALVLVTCSSCSRHWCSRRSPRPIRSGTSRSTDTAASRSRGTGLYVPYVLDMAEIPTFQARQDGVDPGTYVRRIAQQRPSHGRRPCCRLTPVGTCSRTRAAREA